MVSRDERNEPNPSPRSRAGPDNLDMLNQRLDRGRGSGEEQRLVAGAQDNQGRHLASSSLRQLRRRLGALDHDSRWGEESGREEVSRATARLQSSTDLNSVVAFGTFRHRTMSSAASEDVYAMIQRWRMQTEIVGILSGPSTPRVVRMKIRT